MSKRHISTINGVEIFAEIAENGTVFVPIKPICEALGIEHTAQKQRIHRHYILSSTEVTVTSVAADGKAREMTCLPLEYVYGWLFTIDANLVAENVRDRVAEYQRQCYDALYRHFAGSMKRQIETNEAEIAALRAVNDALTAKKQADEAYKQAQKHLDKVRASRLDNAPCLDL